MSIGYITDDVCEEVVICDPNEILQDCLPGGEEMICEYVIDLTLESSKYHNLLDYRFVDGVFGPKKVGDPVVWDFMKMAYIDDATGVQQDRWLGVENGSSGNDEISGKGLLEAIRDGLPFVDSNIQGLALAQVDPSVYLGDLVHFDIDGGAGNDKIIGANNADILSGGSGADEVYGLRGDDNIAGNAGSDDLNGGAGNDWLFGDERVADANDDGVLTVDELTAAAGDAAETAADGVDTIEGESGDDVIFGGGSGDILYGDFAQGETSSDGDDNLYGGSGGDQLWGRGGDDYSDGGSGNDIFVSGTGDDCSTGGEGDDLMFLDTVDSGFNSLVTSADGDDLATGDAGDDTMWGGGGNDKLDGGADNDKVYGQDGNDLLDGGSGDDMVWGGEGDDIIRGGTGNDSVWGGAGCDIFAFCEVSFGCKDIIEDFSAGRDPDQIDLTQLDIDSIRVEQTGFTDEVRFDLLVNGEAVQQILVASDVGANLESVFDKDTAFGTDAGALVRLADGVMVDLPSVSLMVVDDGMFF